MYNDDRSFFRIFMIILLVCLVSLLVFFKISDNPKDKNSVPATDQFNEPVASAPVSPSETDSVQPAVPADDSADTSSEKPFELPGVDISSESGSEAVSSPQYEYFRSLLNPDDQASYDIVRNAVSDFGTDIVMETDSEASFEKIMNAVALDHPEMFWFHVKCDYAYDRDRSFTIKPKYLLTEEESEACSVIIDKAFDQLSTECKNLDDYGKVKKVIEYLVNNTEYDTAADDQTCYGLFTQNKALCAGYSTAFKLLMDRFNINSISVPGSAIREGSSQPEPHIWNMVKLGDDWFHVDPTFCDPVADDGSQVLSYDFFLLNDSEIYKDHIADESKFEYPKSNGICAQKEADTALEDVVTPPSGS